MNTFFVLQLYSQKHPWDYSHWRDIKKDKKKQEEYLPYELEKEMEGIYPSLDKAEEAMRLGINKYERYIYCCYIAEVPEETSVKDFLRENYSLRVYDEKGMKLDERLFKSRSFADLAHSENYGRKPEECRFKQGDVVEYIDWHRGHGVIGVVECIILEHRDTPIGDDSDDGYLIWRVDKFADHIIDSDECKMFGLHDDYIRCTEVFAPHHTISATVQKRIENIREFIKHRQENKE